MIIINDDSDTSNEYDLGSSISNEDKMLISRENSFMNTDVDVPVQQNSWIEKEKWRPSNLDNHEVVDLTQEGSLFEDSSQASCSYTLIDESDQEGYLPTEDSNKESQTSIKSQSRAYLDHHKPILQGIEDDPLIQSQTNNQAKERKSKND
ncbi:4728_t:CDS:2, partial [Racocetra fulgida]